MAAKILNGLEIAQSLRNKIKSQIKTNITNGQARPTLAVILVGDDHASNIYVKNKEKACHEVGIESKSYRLEFNATESELLELINTLNINTEIDGILVQLPLPKHINQTKIINSIAVNKDVDGFHPLNIGKLVQRQPGLRPCTPAGIISLLEHTQISFHGLETTVIGASNIVGRPVALELLIRGATPTICHRFTKNLSEHVLRADCVISAVGKIGLIKGEWIKRGAIVIDVGINRLESGSIIGDVEFEQAREKASWITPVPGGVGPMTIVKLLENTLFAQKLKHDSIN